jgi:glycosyltransferase 2 family protein
MSNLKSRSTALEIFGTLIAIGLLYLLLKEQGWGDIKTEIKKISPLSLAISILIMLISRFSVINRWYTLLKSAEIKISFWQTMQITFAGLFLTNFLPTTIGGDLIRLISVVRMKLDAAICTASLIVDRLIGLFGMALALPFALPVLLTNQLFFIPQEESKPNLFFLANFSWLKKIFKKISDLLQRFYNALKIWKNSPMALAKSLAWSLLHMLCLFTIIHLLLDKSGESLPFWQIAGFYSLVYLITLIPISINGYGVQEISMSFVFSHLGGISLQTSITIALLFRTIMMLASLPGVLFVPVLLSSKYHSPNQ